MYLENLDLNSKEVKAKEIAQTVKERYNGDKPSLNLSDVLDKQHGGKYHGLLVAVGLELIGEYSQYSHSTHRLYNTSSLENSLGGDTIPDIINSDYKSVVEAGNINARLTEKFDSFEDRVRIVLRSMIDSDSVKTSNIPLYRFFHVDREFFDEWAFDEDDLLLIENPSVEMVTVNSFDLRFERDENRKVTRFNESILKVFRDKFDEPTPSVPDINLYN